MATDAEMVAKYREKAKDKTLPQDARNMYLDKAVELEQKAYKQMKGESTMGSKFAKGGAVHKMPNGKMMKDSAMAKKGAKVPAVAIMIGVAKPKAKMAKGGMAKKKC
jgi:hypothetical protein